jgi:LysM domain-containing protein
MDIDYGPQPPPRRGPSWISVVLAAFFGAALAILVGVVFVLPGLRQGDSGALASPNASLAPGSTAAVGSPGPSPSRTFVRPTPTPQPTPLIYFVKSGDSLNSIAEEFRTKARSIAFWNRDRYPSLDPDSPEYRPDRIGVGWTLTIIPGTVVDEDTLPTRSPAGPSPSPAETPGG